MKYISVTDFAKKYGISDRTARNYCAVGKIEGAILVGKTWNIPNDAELPMRKTHKKKLMPLLIVLREQKEMKLKGGIYHRTQIDFTYNSNHIEGSKLTHEQTRYIFETNTIETEGRSVHIDDITETTNHFRCIDLIIDQTDIRLTESLIKQLHFVLKSGTSDSQKEWFAIGEYKLLPNEVGGNNTTAPENVKKELRALLKDYNAKKKKHLMIFLIFIINLRLFIHFKMGMAELGDLLCLKNA
jgi:hypothetical protein